MKRKSVIIAVALILVGAVVCVFTIPVVKSFTSLLLWRVRGRTGTIYLQVGEDMMAKRYYANGIREGVWITYDKTGHEVSRSEYRNGEPWSGICYIYDMKMWIGEYRDGKPWHGCLPVYKPASQETDWDYFIDGKNVDYAEYCKEWKLSGPGHNFAGLAYLGVDQGPTE